MNGIVRGCRKAACFIGMLGMLILVNTSEREYELREAAVPLSNAELP